MAQNAAGPGLHPVNGGLYRLAALHQSQLHTVHRHLIAGPVEAPQHRRGGHGQGGHHIDERIQGRTALPEVVVREGAKARLNVLPGRNAKPGRTPGCGRKGSARVLWIKQDLIHGNNLLSVRSQIVFEVSPSIITRGKQKITNGYNCVSYTFLANSSRGFGFFSILSSIYWAFSICCGGQTSKVQDAGGELTPGCGDQTGRCPEGIGLIKIELA